MIRGKTLISTPKSPIFHLSREEFWNLNENGILSVGFTVQAISFESSCMIFLFEYYYYI